MKSISSPFHSIVIWLISEEMVESSSKPGMRGIAPFGKHPGIHLSWNTRICVPSPTLHIIPFSITCLALSKLCQAKEPVEHFASKTDPEGKYLVLKTLYSRDSFSIIFFIGYKFYQIYCWIRFSFYTLHSCRFSR